MYRLNKSIINNLIVSRYTLRGEECAEVSRHMDMSFI